MFGLLKQKLSNFISKLVKKEEEVLEAAPQDEKPIEKAPVEQTPAEKQDEKPKAHGEKPAVQTPVEKQDEKPNASEKKQEEKPAEKPPAKKEEKKQPIEKAPEKKQEERQQAPKTEGKQFSFELPFFGKKPEQPVAKTEPEHKLQAHKTEEPVEKIEFQKQQVRKPEQPASEPVAHKPQPDLKQEEKPQQPVAKKPQEHKQERKMEVKIGWGEQIKSIFTGEVQIKEGDIRELLEELQLALLEADVAYEVSAAVCEGLKAQLVGMKIRRAEVNKAATQAMQASLESVLSSDLAFDFIERVRGLPKPAAILFVGPNGAGKTTTMAKLARMLMGCGMSVVFSASDTFRAAAIEQTEAHASRLGVHVVKSTYGADPAAVAFDAIAYAKAHKIDVVLIDSAGRQDTNTNLLDELKKMSRVAKPALKIYIGESIAGNAVIEQINAFNSAIGIDGVILTKLDCDAKGGTALSITYTTKIPIVFFGVGQKYADLVSYSPRELAQQILT